MADNEPQFYAVVCNGICSAWALLSGSATSDVSYFGSGFIWHCVISSHGAVRSNAVCKSEPAHYGSDFSKVHIAQNVGVIFASLLVGVSVEQFSSTVPFYFAAIGFTGLALLLLWRVKFAGRTARIAS